MDGGKKSKNKITKTLRKSARKAAEVYAGKMRDYKNENVTSLTKDLLCAVTIVLASVYDKQSVVPIYMYTPTHERF